MFVRFEDFNLAYEDRGRDTPLLLIHGFPLNHYMWDPQLEALAGRARMVAPDLRGHGASGSPHGVYTMERLAEDCKALLDALAITEPVVVCGHSMGGYVSSGFPKTLSRTARRADTGVDARFGGHAGRQGCPRSDCGESPGRRRSSNQAGDAVQITRSPEL